jgi:tetratricopeptide (TPR) repeat protein
MKRIIFVILVFTCFSKISSSQDFDGISKAFTSSYSFEKAGNYDEAAKEIIKVYDDSSYEINLRLGWLMYKSGSYLESLGYYEKAIAINPYAIEPRFGYNYPATALGNWTQAEEQYMKILTIDPMNSSANYWLGMIYYNREDYMSALKYFEKVVNLYPFDYDGTIMFAWTNLKILKLREAKLLFQKALLIKPGDSSALEGLASIQ